MRFLSGEHCSYNAGNLTIIWLFSKITINKELLEEECFLNSFRLKVLVVFLI